MAASRCEIRDWLNLGKESGATHMIVVCDTYDHEDYPVYVKAGKDVNEEIRKSGGSMQRVMEVYNMSMDLETQILEERAYHL